MKPQIHTDSRDRLISAATRIAQSRGYGGLSIRMVADDVGIKPASIYYHFPGKAELATAVAKRYWEDAAEALQTLSANAPSIKASLATYPEMFRKSLESDNRICLYSFMAAEVDDLPEIVKIEIQRFVDVHIAWLSTALVAAKITPASQSENRARAIFSAVAGAQLLARSRRDITLFDTIIDSYRDAGLLQSRK